MSRRPDFVKLASFAANHRNWYGLMARDYIDQAIISAYTENVGHAPRNLQWQEPGFDQWTYSPRTKNARQVLEAARSTGRQLDPGLAPRQRRGAARRRGAGDYVPA